MDGVRYNTLALENRFLTDKCGWELLSFFIGKPLERDSISSRNVIPLGRFFCRRNKEIEMKTGWKVPTPTDIRRNENIDILSRLLFFEILNGAQNKEYHKVFYHGNKRIDLTLKRGQYLFNVSFYQRELNIPRKRIEKSLETLQKWYIEMTIERKPFGLVVTIKDYDWITKMRNERRNEIKTKLKRNENEVKSKNKNDKSEKSDIAEAGSKYLNYWNKKYGTKYRSIVSVVSNLEFWLKQYSWEEIRQAVDNIPYHDFWKDKATPLKILRRKSTKGEPVDYIGELLNIKTKEGKGKLL